LSYLPSFVSRFGCRGWDRRKIANSTKRDESDKVMFYSECVCWLIASIPVLFISSLIFAEPCAGMFLVITLIVAQNMSIRRRQNPPATVMLQQ
jgi:hypothetical protein